MNRIQCLVFFLVSATHLMATDGIAEPLEDLRVKPKHYTGPSAHVLNPEKPDVLLNSDPDWTCKVWYISKDTRSEGMHVQLFFKGQPVRHDTDFAKRKVTIPYGGFEWKGSWAERKNLFDLSGWVPVKVETLHPSKGRTLGK